MPSHKTKITSRKSRKSYQDKDGAWVSQRAWSRGGIHVATTVAYAKHFDREYPARVEVYAPDGTLYETVTEKVRYGYDPVGAVIDRLAESLRGA